MFPDLKTIRVRFDKQTEAGQLNLTQTKGAVISGR